MRFRLGLEVIKPYVELNFGNDKLPIEQVTVGPTLSRSCPAKKGKGALRHGFRVTAASWDLPLKISDISSCLYNTGRAATCQRRRKLLAARLLEFFSTNTPWHRALWNPGLVLCLRELLEASEAVRAGVLHEDSLRSLAETCVRLSASDPGAGNEDQRHALQQTLQSQTKPKLRFGGIEYHVLKRLTDDIEADYLKASSRHSLWRSRDPRGTSLPGSVRCEWLQPGQLRHELRIPPDKLRLSG